MILFNSWYLSLNNVSLKQAGGVMTWQVGTIVSFLISILNLSSTLTLLLPGLAPSDHSHGPWHRSKRTSLHVCRCIFTLYYLFLRGKFSMLHTRCNSVLSRPPGQEFPKIMHDRLVCPYQLSSLTPNRYR